MQHLKMLFTIPPSEELSERHSKLIRVLEDKNLDCILIFSNVNLFYFTNSIQKGCLIITENKTPVYLVQRYLDRAKAETCEDVIKVVGIRSLKEISLYLRELGLEDCKRIGLEFEEIPLSFFLKLKNIIGDKEFIDVSLDILRIRSIKSEFELAQMKKAAEMSDKVFSKVGSFIKEGMSEVELAGLIQAVSRKLGNQEIIRMRGFNNELTNPHLLSGRSATIPSSGDVPLSGYGMNPAIAQGASLKKILRGEPIIVDYAGSSHGYTTDETRLFVIDKLPNDLERAYWVSREILDFVENHVREGVNGKDVYASIIKIVEKNRLIDHFMGYKTSKVRFVAHGIGLVINEFPIIADSRDEELKTNMVFSIEPKFIFPDKGAVGVETDYVVKKDRVERLSSFPLDIVKV